ncbi:unnamed protein product [Closterium sp. NIES-64]|nr:unnamed protein product [Closterium sp. NIES-64]
MGRTMNPLHSCPSPPLYFNFSSLSLLLVPSSLLSSLSICPLLSVSSLSLTPFLPPSPLFSLLSPLLSSLLSLPPLSSLPSLPSLLSFLPRLSPFSPDIFLLSLFSPPSILSRFSSNCLLMNVQTLQRFSTQPTSSFLISPPFLAPFLVPSFICPSLPLSLLSLLSFFPTLPLFLLSPFPLPPLSLSIHVL